MNRTVGLLAAFAISVAMHAFGEDVKNPWVWTPADAESDSASFPTYAGGKYDGAFSLNSGTLVFDDLSEKFPVEEGFSVNVSGEVELDAWDRRKIVFKYHSNSGNYETHTEYSNSCFTESIKDFITKKNPIAPDGASLSGKIVFASGFFFVPENEVGSWLFEGIYDDNVLLKIDGKPLFKTGSYTDRRQESTDHLGYGWHRFEIRARDGSGDWGAADFLKAQSPGSSSWLPFHEGNFQMGRRVTNKASRYVLKSLSLEDAAKVVIHNEAVVGSELRLGESCEVYVAENSSLDLRSTQVVGKIRKTGAGAIVFGEDLPEEIVIDSGTLVLMIDHSYDMNKVTLGNGVAVRGLTADGKVIAVGGALGADGKTTYSPLPKFTYTGSEDIPADGFGSLSVSGENTVLTIDSAVACDVLSEVIVRSGATLKVDSHVTIDKLVLEGSGALVVGEGGNVKLSTCSEETVDGQASVISVLSGGALKMTGPVAVSSVCLKGDASLVIESFTAEIAEFVFEESSDKIPVLAIAESGCLIVPGGSKFGSVAMTVKGQLKSKGQGGIVLGYASAGETRKFDLLVEGGEIETEDGNIDFACPESGGTVLPVNGTAWMIKSASLFPSRAGGFNFGKSNPATGQIDIVFDDTELTYSSTGVYYIQGKSSLYFKNGSKLYKGHDTGYAASFLHVENQSKLIFENSELYWGMGGRYGNTGAGCGALWLKPDEEGFCSLKLVNSKFYYYHLMASSKPVIEINNSVYTAEYASWNYFMPFDGRNDNKNSEVYSPGSIDLLGDLYFRSKSLDNFEMPGHVPFSGAGNIYFEKPEGCKSYTYTVKSADNSATGSIMASDDTLLVFASKASWVGTVVYNDNVRFEDLPENSPGEITVGALDLQMPLVYRVWESGNDKINFTGRGIIPNGHEVRLVLQDGFVPSPGMTFDLGTVPADFDLSSIINNNNRWSFSLVDIEGDESRKILQVVACEADYTFNGGSGETKVVDLGDPAGWKGGVVPEWQDVVIDGVTVIAEGEIPSFSLMTFKNGGSIIVRKPLVSEGEYMGTLLPGIDLRSGSSFILEDSAIVNLSGTMVVNVAQDETLPVISVGKDACLNLPGGQRFGNCSILIDGGKVSTVSDGGLNFGYAAQGKTTRFSMFATNAVITSFRLAGSASTKNASRIDFGVVDNGGKVLFDAPVEIVSSKIDNNVYDGFAFGLNNPEEIPLEIIVDNTVLNYGAETVVAGGAHLVLTNKASLYHIRKGWDNLRVDEVNYPLVVKERGLITLVDGGSILTPLGRIDNDWQGALTLNPSQEGWFGVEVLKGGLAGWRKTNGSKTETGANWTPVGSVRFADSTLVIAKGYWHGWGNCADDLLYGLSSVNIQEGTTLSLMGEPLRFSDNFGQNLKFTLESPFTGSGNVIIGSVRTDVDMEPIISCTENTCTGTITAENPSQGNKKTKLYFEDGSNWAGTVVANGNVYVLDKDCGVSYTHNVPVSVSFGALDLQADFSVKVWKDGNGNITGNDTLNVGEYINNGGRLVPELAGEGEFVLGDKIVVGEIGDSSPLPRVAKGWTASRKTIDGKSMLVLGKGVGFMVIVR